MTMKIANHRTCPHKVQVFKAENEMSFAPKAVPGRRVRCNAMAYHQPPETSIDVYHKTPQIIIFSQHFGIFLYHSVIQ